MSAINWENERREQRANRKPSYNHKPVPLKRTPSPKQRFWGRKYMAGYLAAKGLTIEEMKAAEGGFWPTDDTLAELCRTHGAIGRDFVDVFSCVHSLGARALEEFL